jgi:hypothetical protein
MTPDKVYRGAAEASWNAPGTRTIWAGHQRDTYITLMLARPNWRALVDHAYRAGREAAARAIEAQTAGTDPWLEAMAEAAAIARGDG